MTAELREGHLSGGAHKAADLAKFTTIKAQDMAHSLTIIPQLQIEGRETD